MLEVPRAAWQSFFDDLSKRYYGWAVSLEVIGRKLGDYPLADGLPLQGISFEPRGSRAGDILIDVGDVGFPVETHHVNRPRAVRSADTQPGLETDIQIESEDGTSAIIRLRPRPVLPAGG